MPESVNQIVIEPCPEDIVDEIVPDIVALDSSDKVTKQLPGYKF